MTVIGYVREPQEGQDCTLEEQRAAIEAYCQANAFELTCIVEDAADQASIGLLYRSQGYQLQAAEDAHLVFVNYRRSFKNYDDFAVAERTLTGHRNILHMLDWHVRSDHAAWPLLLHILGDIRGRQVEARSETKIRFSKLRKLHQKRARKNRKWSINATVPWGYSRVTNYNRNLVFPEIGEDGLPDIGTYLKINRREIYLMSLITELRRKGFSWNRIIRSFNKTNTAVPRQPDVEWMPSIVYNLHKAYQRFLEPGRQEKMRRYFKPS